MISDIGQDGSNVLVGPVPFVGTTPDAATAYVIDLIGTRSAVSIRLANAYCVALASTDRDYRRLLAGNGLNFPDGLPVAWCMRILSRAKHARRVRGPSLFTAVLDKGRDVGIRHYFLGATEDTLECLVENVTQNFAGVEIAGSFAPPFGPVDDKFVASACEKVIGSGADVVWVALGTPKQDFATERLAAVLGVPCIGVGAAFDFVAETVREAPTWMQRYGLEWLFRFASEPARLWKRYTVGNIMFLRAVAIQHASKAAR